MKGSVLVASVALIAFSLPSCTPAPVELTAAEILQRSAEAMSRVQSLHFRLEVVNGTMPVGPGMAATSLEGDAVAPDRIKVVVKARFGNAPIEMEAVTIGNKSYITNPLNRQWQEVAGIATTPALLSPERGIGSAIRQVADPRRLGVESVDGAESYHLRGTLPSEVLASLVGGQAAAGEAVTVEVWVDATSFLLRQVKLVGAIVAGEAGSLEHSLKLSDFEKAVEIPAPI